MQRAAVYLQEKKILQMNVGRVLSQMVSSKFGVNSIYPRIQPDLCQQSGPVVVCGE